MSTTNAWAEAHTAGEPGAIERLGGSILDKVLDKANARMVFSDPVAHGDRTVITVARVSTRYGFGGGGGRTNKSDGPEGGGGGGGGGSIDAKPIGYIEITDMGAEFHEIQDSTQIALTALRVLGVIAVLVMIKVLFLGGRKKSEPATVVAVPVSGPRLRIPFRRKSAVDVTDELPADEVAQVRRWIRRAA
jgi:uncharacterized spore protein YtfJ